MAYSPDGKLLASEGPESTATLWDVQTGKAVTTLPGDLATAIAFSPDGKLLATGNNYGLSLWDTASQQIVASLGQTTDTNQITQVSSVAFSPDGKLLAAGGVVSYNSVSTPSLQLWDVLTHKRVALLDTGKANIVSIAFSPNGKLLAVGSDENKVSLWAMRRGYPLVDVWDFPAYEPGPVGIAFSPDGQLLALSGRGGLIQLRVVNGAVVASVQGQDTTAIHLAFSPDGKVLGVGSDNGTITLWGVH
jgi:WD40 repeat protein